VPVHSCGGGRRGIGWGEPVDRAGAIAVLRRAVELGVDFIDRAKIPE